jgi:hypothetical protein
MAKMPQIHRLKIEIKLHRLLATLIKVIRLRRRTMCGFYIHEINIFKICELSEAIS